MQKTCSLLLAFLIFSISSPAIQAQERHSHRHAEDRDAASESREPCFDAANPSEHRLWSGNAPGATGEDPCRDISFVSVYPAIVSPEVTKKRGPSPAILIFPGGGYDHLTDTLEQEPVAEYFSQKLHVTAILVRYRLVQKDGLYAYPVPMWDGQRAIRLVRMQAARWNIDPERIGIFGFSAGGHLASTLVLHPEDSFGLPSRDEVDAYSDRVRFLGLGYPVISMDPRTVPPSGSYKNLLKNVPEQEREHLEDFLSGEQHVTDRMPPVFLFESLDDARISPQNSILFANALRAAGVPSDVHLFQHGEHGSGLSVGIPEEEQWPADFAAWLQRIRF